MTVRNAVKGTRIQALEAVRDALAAALDEAVPSEAASLAKQLVAVVREIDELRPVKVANPIDDLGAKRIARRSAAKAAASA